uniref:Uncharacterized protein n=1 Tax=Romanomermis culicivorax TaxID=13658 RepID=A0A915HUN4_ROMCU
MNYERGFIVVIVSFGLLTSIFGFLYFFRLLCCRSRRRRRSEEKFANSNGEPEACRRYCSNSVLFLLVVLICSLIACAFMYNHRAHESIATLGNIAEKSVDDLEDYKLNTLKETKIALINNFQELKQRINHQLDDSVDDFISFTFSALKSTLFSNLSNFTSELELLNNIMKKMIMNLNESGVEIEQLESNITEVESWLLYRLNICLNNPETNEQSECKKALTSVRQYADSTRGSATDFKKQIEKQGRFLRTLLWSLDAATISRNISENLNQFRSKIKSELTEGRK